MNRTAIIVGLGIAVTCAALTTLAGPITPPIGPVGSTAKPLAEIEPRIAVNAVNTPPSGFAAYRISQPGSYYLTSNLTGVAGKHGIEIASSGVTLNLNGFELLGVAGAFSGVIVSTPVSNIAILNGSIRSWPLRGVDAVTFTATNCRFSDLIVANNTQAGLRISNASEITRCICAGNGADGINVGIGCTITGCTLSHNTGSGIVANSSATISNSTSWQNSGDGFSIGSGSTATNCTAYNNSGNGFTGSSGSTVARSNAYLNSIHGISVTYACTVLDNICTFNSIVSPDGAGINCDFGGTRIEGNTCTQGRRGIQVNNPGNIIIRNTCAGNSTANWTIAADNTYGPIIDRRIPSPIGGTPAVNGASAASTLGTTDPNANFTY